MKFLNWFRRKPPITASADAAATQHKRAITISAEIVVSPRKPPRTDLPEFSVEEPEGVVNLWPFACEVLATYPKKVPVSPEVLARLCVMGHNGKYIKVGLYPQDMDRDEVKMLMHRTMAYARWPDRFTRMMRSARVAPTQQLKPGQLCCAQAKRLAKAPVETEDVSRLPLDGCWEMHCMCHWSSISKFRKT